MTDKHLPPRDPSPETSISRLMTGFGQSQAISVAARLKIADLVGEKPRIVEELATATGTHAPSLRRVLQYLASLGIFEEDEGGKYRNTPMSEPLRSDHPRSVRSGAIMIGSPLHWRPWERLYEAVVTGQPAFDRVYGSPMFDYLKAHPEEAAMFNAAMSEGSTFALSAIPAAYDFSRFEQLVDVGGGHGGLLAGILSANPKLRGVLFDLPQVVADASATLRSLADRCEIVGGDFFKAVPEGADGYLMKGIIHDWSDEHALRILRTCRRAIRPGGTLLLLERVLKPANQLDPARLMDLNMMLLLGGRERTESDFRALLSEAGFSLTRVITTPVPWWIIESRPT